MKINKKCLDEAYSATFDLKFLKIKKKEKSRKYKNIKSNRKNRLDHDFVTFPSVSKEINAGKSVEKRRTNDFFSQTFDHTLNNIHTNKNIINELVQDFVPIGSNEIIDDDIESIRQNKINFFNDIFIKDYIYPGSEVEINDFFLALYSLKLKHSLNTKTIDDFLKLLRLILPKDNKCPKTYSKIEKFLSSEEKNHSVFFCCVSCKSLSKQNISLQSLNTKINICINCSNELSPFVTFNVKSQITRILENENLLNQVVKNNMPQSHSQSLFDMNNGLIYKQMQNSKSRAISLVLNTDGAPITNSKNYNMWPILGTIVELDQASRENFNNMVILGIWLSKQKPIYNIFVENSIKELIEIKDQNINVKGLDFNIRAHSIIMDLPAKSAVLNVKQFNGEFGCTYCYHPGEHSGIYNKRIYPPLKFEKRKDSEFSDMVKMSVQTGQTIFGIKGANPISNILSLPSQAPLDYMHLVLQGHGKWLLKQYFFSDKSNDFYIGLLIIKFNFDSF
ncbi:unnamed protein product [Brachionus calyciflorus]|uniref:Uncharacterized protein n=1 Tax=Brachionus calyciflorus TaxID=104777 RepID=A0A814LQL9_9BILA|nr:unnamed protein product [Brachionus calyciflorus]